MSLNVRSCWFSAAAIVFAIAAPVFAQTARNEKKSSAGDAIQRDANRLMDLAMASRESYGTVAHLTDKIGSRLSGSAGAAEAVKWTTAQLQAWGVSTHTEKVMVPHWVRGVEQASLVSHNSQKIVLTALGGSVATPPGGITADIIEARSFDELKTFGRARIAGKIVFFNVPMDMDLVRAGRAFDAYGKAVEYRGRGADRAAEYGAVASLIRSVSSASLRTPHTGAMRYEGKVKKIPAAAMTAEDAMLVDRLLTRGDRVRMHLVLTPRTLPDVESANVVAEIRGSEKPDEIVLIGGHLDSWDLGPGAIDDAGGVAMVMDTMRLIHQFGRTPRRTIRCVLFMNEENGLRGGRGYAAAHAAEISRHVAAIEADAGSAAPRGFLTTLKGDVLMEFETRVAFLDRVGAAKFDSTDETGADTSPLIDKGVVGFGLVPDQRHYFDYHHSPADTLDKIDPQELAQNTAALAGLTWFLANQ